MRNPLIFLSICRVTNWASAQSVVLADDFNDSQVAPMRTVDFDQLQFCGPCGPWLGQLHVDDLEIYAGPLFSGPSLSTPGLVAGSVSQLNLSGAAANGSVAFAYSTTGAGPTMTPYGFLDLSTPIRRLPTILTDVNGNAQLSSAIHPGMSELTV